uniref:Uncharacterized protein n=1 Tax=Arundo donax TaxID=35708 RepID=A0A0A9CWM7_ARUDO
MPCRTTLPSLLQSAMMGYKIISKPPERCVFLLISPMFINARSAQVQQSYNLTQI